MLAERVDESFEPHSTLGLCCRIGIGRYGRCDCEPEAHEQRKRFGRDAKIPLNPGDLSGKPVEASGKCCLLHLGIVGREKGFERRLDN